MEIHLQLFSILREKLPPEAKGQKKLQLNEGTTLADILADLGISRRVVISVNGDHETDKLRQLHDGDEVKIFSSVSGGAPSGPSNPDVKERNTWHMATMEKSCM